MTQLPDSIIAVIWLGATALLGTVGWVTAVRQFPHDTVLNRISHTIVIGWAHIVVVATTLGALGWLLPFAFLAGVSGSATLTFLITRRLSQPITAGVDSIPVATDQTSEVGGWLWPAVWSVLFAFWVGHSVTAGLWRFPTDWDTLMYHLPMVNHWIQARSLYAPDGLRWSDPGNNELVTLWLVAPFSGDFLYSLTNLPATVLLACASVELGCQLGLSSAWRNLAAMAVVTNFVVFKQLIDAENDVAVAAFLLAGLAYALRFADRRCTTDGMSSSARASPRP